MLNPHLIDDAATQSAEPERKLIILPAAQGSWGGTLFSLMMLMKGIEQCGHGAKLLVLVQRDSLMESQLSEAGLADYLVSIPGSKKVEFLHQSMAWVHRQPRQWPLLLENCVQRDILWPLVCHSLKLRLHQRPVYLLFRDLAISYNPIGYLTRKLTFMMLGLQAICNSHFTASHIRNRYVKNVKGVLYPPIDLTKFQPLRKSTRMSATDAMHGESSDVLLVEQSPRLSTPEFQPLQAVIKTGKPLLLTVSRINQPGIINDKNLRMLPTVLAALRAKGQDYYGVIVGQDKSPNQINSQELYALAERLGVGDRFQILPPSAQIETYYHHATALLTLAPREPFGRTVVEAIACGLPVIGSNSGGISEILSQIAPEWMVDPHDATAATDAILRLTNPPPDMPSVQDRLQQGRLWIETHCSVMNTAKGLMAVVGLGA